MKVYLDVVFFLNFAFDFLLLLTVSIVLKRNCSIKRILLASLVGGMSILSLFLPLSSFFLFLLKVLLSIFMVLIAFGWRSRTYFRENLCYLYLVSIILGGFLYFLKIQFSYQNTGFVFFFKGYRIPVVVLIILSPIILFFYYKSVKKMKVIQENYHIVEIDIDGHMYSFSAYLDTGNHLYDPYHHRPILLVYSNQLNIPYEKAIIVPYETVGHQGILTCKKVKKIVIDQTIEKKDVLVAKSPRPFQIEGVDVILHPDFFK